MRVDRGLCAEGVMLHDGVEGVVVRGGGGVCGGSGRGQRCAHVFRAQRGQPQRLRRPRLGVQRAPEVQDLPHHIGSPSLEREKAIHLYRCEWQCLFYTELQGHSCDYQDVNIKAKIKSALNTNNVSTFWPLYGFGNKH